MPLSRHAIMSLENVMTPLILIWIWKELAHIPVPKFWEGNSYSNYQSFKMFRWDRKVIFFKRSDITLYCFTYIHYGFFFCFVLTYTAGQTWAFRYPIVILPRVYNYLSHFQIP